MESQSNLEISLSSLWPKLRLVQVVSSLFAERTFSALSLYYLAKLGAGIQNVLEIYSPLMLLFLFYFLKNLVLIPSRYLETTLSLESYYNALDVRSFGQSGARKWANHKAKENFLGAIGFQLFDAIRNLTNSYREILNFSLNFIISLTIFGFFLKDIVVLALGGALVISLSVYFLSKVYISKVASEQKHQEVKFFSYLSSLWDNVILNDRSISQGFKERLNSEKSIYKSKLQFSFLVSDIAVFGVQNLSWIPMIIVNFWIIYSGSLSGSEILLAVVLIPKQIELMDGIRTVNQMLTFWQQDKRIYEKAMEMTLLEDANVASRVRLNEISVNGKKMNSFKDLIQFIQALPQGRILIKGDNGTGKSSLLILIHEYFEQSFYLPTKPNLLIKDTQDEQRSTGQSLADHLDHLTKVPEQVLLLDEWDANLDPTAKEKWNQKIDELAARKLIIEVRH